MALQPVAVISGEGVFVDSTVPNAMVLVKDGKKTNVPGTGASLLLGDIPGGGSIGTAATTVDLYSSVDIAQTTAAQTMTLPNPTNTDSGKELSVSNTGSTAFTITASIASGASARFKWTGAAWSRFA
jgi:hypothetical protein